MIRFGTLGTARITPSALIYPASSEPRVSIRAVAAREPSRATAFAQHHNIPKVYDTYQQVIDDEKVDAIYIPLPIAAHHEWTLKALAAGKHVLCEKSFSSNEAEAIEMQEAANKAGLVVMDAFHYRYHPMFERAVAIIRSGELGDLQRLDAAFSVPFAMDPGDIRMDYTQGGGVTMDIGCYPVSWVRHLSGEEPVNVTATAEIGPPDVDVYLEAELTFPSGTTATIAGDMRGRSGLVAKATVSGTGGSMQLINPLAPQSGHQLVLNANGHQRTEVFDRRTSYSYQLDAFVDAIESGKPLLTGPQDAVNQMKAIDACYLAAGMRLRGEQ